MVLIERTDAAFNLQLKNVANKLPTYQSTFGLSAAIVATTKADSIAFDYTLNNTVTIQTFSHNYTKFKTELRHGHVANLGGFPALPTLGTAPAIVTADIEARLRTLLQTIIHHPNYTLAIGQDLGIVAAPSTFNPATGKPMFTIMLTAGGHPTLSYTRGEFDGVEIWKDSGAGFTKLERITQTSYTDNTALPAANVATVWHYKMIFLYKDAVVGAYSDVVSITVNGQTGANPTLGTTPVPSNQ